MDHAVIRFRQAAARENRGRRDVRHRRYSATLRRQAVEYWITRRARGARLRDVAATLGVAHWSLHRWAQEWQSRARFRPVAVASEPAPVTPARVVVVIGATGPRVEGLDVESAARLLMLLR